MGTRKRKKPKPVQTQPKDYVQKHQEDLERIRNFCLMDDDFMSAVFSDPECAQIMLRVIMQKPDLVVARVKTQHDIKNSYGRSVRLDVFATDSQGILYDVEIQRSDKGGHAKRARYNSSLMDANITVPGEDYKALPETYTIFITENDVLKKGLPIYHISRIIKETGEEFPDDSRIIYVNATIKDDTELGRLMHDFSCTNPDDMYNKVLAKHVRYFKENEKGVEQMCRAMEQMRAETARETALQVTLENARKTVLRVYQAEKSLAKAALYAFTSEEQAKEWLMEAGLM